MYIYTKNDNWAYLVLLRELLYKKKKKLPECKFDVMTDIT